MGTMDKVDSFLGWLVVKGYGSLAFATVVLILLIFFQRTVDGEQSRLIVEATRRLDNTSERLESMGKLQDRTLATLERIDEYGPKSQLRRRDGE